MANRAVVKAEDCLPGKIASEMDEEENRLGPSRPRPSDVSSACPGRGTGQAVRLGLGRSKGEVAQASMPPPLV